MQSATRFVFLSFLLLSLILAGCSTAGVRNTAEPITTTSEVDDSLEQYFQGYDGGFVLFDLDRQSYLRYNPERCSRRFIPASTFKIMNSLISLETGVIEDENEVIPWDGQESVLETWNRDHTLQTAIKDSVVWFYQELARRVGKERMQRYVNEAGYGNEDISGEIDTFWLEGGLRISADEQVEFLKRLYQNDLPFSQRTMDIVKEILVLEKTDNFRFSGKTGSAQRAEIHVGWFVGYLETQDNTYFFALNIDSTGLDGIANGMKAQEITRNILKSMELMP